MNKNKETDSLKVVFIGIISYILWVGCWALFEITYDPNSIDKTIINSFIYLNIEIIFDGVFFIIIVKLLLDRYNSGLRVVGWSIIKLKQSFSIIILGFCMWYLQKHILLISIDFLPESTLTSIIPNVFERYSETYQFIILFILVGFYVPMTEELFIRGFVYKTLRQKYNVIVSIAITTSIFILFHPILLWIPVMTIFNIVVCSVYERYKNIWMPIILHSCINCLSILENRNIL